MDRKNTRVPCQKAVSFCTNFTGETGNRKRGGGQRERGSREGVREREREGGERERGEGGERGWERERGGESVIYLLKACSPVKRTGSPQGFSTVQISHKLNTIQNMHITST